MNPGPKKTDRQKAEASVSTLQDRLLAQVRRLAVAKMELDRQRDSDGSSAEAVSRAARNYRSEEKITKEFMEALVSAHCQAMVAIAVEKSEKEQHA